MPSRAARRAKPDDRTPAARAKRSRTLIAWLVGSSVLILTTLLILMLADVRLGQGYFATLWSPLVLARLTRVVMFLPIAALACGAAWALADPRRSYRVTGRVLLVLSAIGAGVWLWWAPPQQLHQHAFNMSSLSQDGAFVVEAIKIQSTLPEYLRKFPTVTMRRTVDDMGGTRVLSNPPLTTVLAYGVRRAAGGDPANPDWLERMLIDEQEVEPLHAVELAHQLRTGMLLTFIWVLGAVPAYGLGRLFLSPAGSVVCATIVMFNPCTVNYVPGKDPGQLLTINLMLWAWFAAWQRRSMPLGALGGAALAVGATAGLVHVWVALIALAATLWQSWRDGSVRTILLNAVAAGAGGLLVCATAYFTIGWNIPVTLLAVSRSWTALQKTFVMNRAVWYAIGLPIFLLFVAPGTWALLGLNLRRIRWGFGTRLTLCTLAVMLIIYFPLGVTYELTRLWVAFVPPLVLGLSIDLPLLRARGTSQRAAVALALIVGVHVMFTALHWSLFDARESELRLMTNRFYS